MKNIVFEKIKLKNFLSFGNEPIELDISTGVTYITGFNKDNNSFNGVGKTTMIVESLSFALFGTPYRKISRSYIRHYGSSEQCIVEVWFSVNSDKYRVVRALGPDELYLFKNDVNITRTKPETTRDISNILGITKEIFSHTIVMTNRDTSSFFSQDKAAKTKFIEGILGLENFADLFKTAKEQFNQSCNDLEKHQVLLNEVQRAVDSNEQNYLRWEDKKHNSISQLKTLLDGLSSSNPVDLSENIKIIEEETEESQLKLDQIVAKKNAALTKISVLENNVQIFTKALDKLSQSSSICPTCKRPLNDTSHSSHINEEKQELQVNIRDNREKINKIKTLLIPVQETIEEISAKIKSNKNKVTLLRNEEQSYKNLRYKIQSHEEELQKWQNAENPFEENRIREKERADDLIQQRLTKLKRNEVLDAVKMLFSPTGIKSVIINRIIDLLNERLNFYLKRLKAPCSVHFNEFFEEKILNNKGEEIEFDNLSGGEKKRVDFSILFTFRDIRRIQSNVSINLSVFDELFDSALCSNAMFEISNLLYEMSERNQEAYYVITHRLENVESEKCNVIHLEKENNTTKIVNN